MPAENPVDSVFRTRLVASLVACGLAAAAGAAFFGNLAPDPARVSRAPEIMTPYADEAALASSGIALPEPIPLAYPKRPASVTAGDWAWMLDAVAGWNEDDPVGRSFAAWHQDRADAARAVVRWARGEPPGRAPTEPDAVVVYGRLIAEADAIPWARRRAALLPLLNAIASGATSSNDLGALVREIAENDDEDLLERFEAAARPRSEMQAVITSQGWNQGLGAYAFFAELPAKKRFRSFTGEILSRAMGGLSPATAGGITNHTDLDYNAEHRYAIVVGAKSRPLEKLPRPGPGYATPVRVPSDIPPGRYVVTLTSLSGTNEAPLSLLVLHPSLQAPVIISGNGAHFWIGQNYFSAVDDSAFEGEARVLVVAGDLRRTIPVRIEHGEGARRFTLAVPPELQGCAAYVMVAVRSAHGWCMTGEPFLTRFAGADSAPRLSELIAGELMAAGAPRRVIEHGGNVYDLELVPMPPKGEMGALVRMRDGRLVAAHVPDPRHGGYLDYRELRLEYPASVESDRDRLMHDNGPDGLGRLVAEAIAFEAGAEVGIVNLSSIRGHIPAGAISWNLVGRALPFWDEITVIRLTGGELAALRSDAASSTPRLAIASREGAEGDSIFSSDRIYTVAVPMFLREARGGFETLANAEEIAFMDLTVDEAVLRYLARQSR